MKKIKFIILYTIGFILFIPFFFISFLKRTRFYSFKSHRLGHFVEDYYLYKSNKKFIDIFCFNKIGNSFLKKYIKKKNIVLPKSFVYPIYTFLYFSSLKIEYFKRFICYSGNFTKKSNYENYSINRKIIHFNNFERKIGNNFLKTINPDNRKIICLNITNLDHLKQFKKKDWSHHNYRKSNIDDFRFLINYFTEKGYLVLRMGHAEKKMNIKKNSKLFIDYAFKYRDDFLDFFLMSKANLYVSTSGGLDYLAFAFNKPMIISAPCIYDFFVENKNIIFMLKRFFNTKTKKNLNIKNIFKVSFEDKDNFFHDKDNFFKKKNIQIRENTQQEWKKIISNFNTLRRNNFKIKDKYKKKSDKFWDLFIGNNHTATKDYYKKNKIKSFYSWSNFK